MFRGKKAATFSTFLNTEQKFHEGFDLVFPPESWNFGHIEVNNRENFFSNKLQLSHNLLILLMYICILYL